jgi:hypothetical protein
MRSMSRMTCVALVAVFALTAVAASSALAAPEWYVKKAGTFAKVTKAVAVQFENKWEITDTKYSLPGEVFAIACKGYGGEGEIEAASKGKIYLFEGQIRECEGAGTNSACKEYTGDSAANLGWNTELYKEGTENRQKIFGNSGKEPAVLFSCRNPIFGTISDTCELKTSTHMKNNTTTGFVEAEFEAKSAKTKCSQGGAEAGEWKGTLTIKPTETEKKAGVEAIKVE